MNQNDQQIRDLAENLRKAGISHSFLDARRMAQSMLEGTNNQTKKSTTIVSGSPIPSGMASAAPSQKQEMEIKALREQLHIAQSRISEFERMEKLFREELQHLKQTLATQTQSNVVITQSAPVQEEIAQMQQISTPQQEAGESLNMLPEKSAQPEIQVNVPNQTKVPVVEIITETPQTSQPTAEDLLASVDEQNTQQESDNQAEEQFIFGTPKEEKQNSNNNTSPYTFEF